MSKTIFQLILLCFVYFTTTSSAGAEALMDSPFEDAAKNDFLTYFEFKEKQATAKPHMTMHVFVNSSSCLLFLGVEESGRIIHMRLVMPRQLIDDLKFTITGRDIVKSFISALATNAEDKAMLTPLMDEIWVRDLDLRPASIKSNTSADTGKSVPVNAYMIGAGPAKPGDRLVFIDKMPVLPVQTSKLYEAFRGRISGAGETLRDCGLGFSNDKSSGDPVLVCDAWDEFFWQRNFEPKKAGKPRSSEMTAALTKAAESLNKGDNLQVISILKPLSTREPADLECLITLGRALEETGDFAGAVPVLKKAADLERETNECSASWSASLHLLYAQALMRTHNQNDAFDEGRKAELIEPNNPQIPLQLGLALLNSNDPVSSVIARKKFATAEKLGSKDSRLPALEAIALIQVGSQAKGLAALGDAIKKIPDTVNENHNFIQEMRAKADAVQKLLSNRAPAPVAAKDRKYKMTPGMAAVVADINESTGIATLGLSGGHDPDGGAQDGNDDGIIEIPSKDLNQPNAALYRPNEKTK